MQEALPTLIIGDRSIGRGHRALVVAEISANHSGSLTQACAIIRAAARAGADAVKFQAYRADDMTVASAAGGPRLLEGSLWEGYDLLELYRAAETPWEWHPALKAAARSEGLLYFSSVFSQASVDLMVRLDVPALKIAGFELTDHALIRAASRTGKPLVLSTGMASETEIDEAVAVARGAGTAQIVLLRGNNAYPARIDEMDLATIADMQDRWGVPVGVSDHSPGTTAAVVAVALGACMVEKHLTIDRSVPTPDRAFSLEPAEFREMVLRIREAEDAVGGIRYGPSESEMNSLALRRSLHAVTDIREGELFTSECVRSVRPGRGLPPKHLVEVLGRRAARDLAKGTPLGWSDIQGGRDLPDEAG